MVISFHIQLDDAIIEWIIYIVNKMASNETAYLYKSI